VGEGGRNKGKKIEKNKRGANLKANKSLGKRRILEKKGKSKGGQPWR